jgi:DNA-binding NarL/FixJ family response regulator
MHRIRKCRIVLADDHVSIRKALHDLLSSHADIDIVGEAANGQEAVEVAAACRPDVVLLDKTMPKMNGIEATAVIRKERKQTVIIGLCTTPDPYAVDAFLKAGAAAVISKDPI